MKLKFDLRKNHIEQLHKILQHVFANIWQSSPSHSEEQLYFYFDSDSFIIYPAQPSAADAFDRVYARIHISNLSSNAGGGFFRSFTIKSLKKNNAVLVSPKEPKSFLEDLKVLCDLGYDAAFRLTQSSDGDDGVKKQYIEVTGTPPGGEGAADAGSSFKSYVEVGCHFSEQAYPQVMDRKEIEFGVDSQTCAMFLARFRERFQVLSDEMAVVAFQHTGVQAAGGGAGQQQQANASERRYCLTLSSQRMSSQVTNKQFEGRMRDDIEALPQYITQLKKEVFLKFFSILKQPGFALFKINHNAKMEMDFTWEKSNSIRVLQEVAARVI